MPRKPDRNSTRAGRERGKGLIFRTIMLFFKQFIFSGNKIMSTECQYLTFTTYKNYERNSIFANETIFTA